MARNLVHRVSISVCCIFKHKTLLHVQSNTFITGFFPHYNILTRIYNVRHRENVWKINLRNRVILSNKPWRKKHTNKDRELSIDIEPVCADLTLSVVANYKQ